MAETSGEPPTELVVTEASAGLRHASQLTLAAVAATAVVGFFLATPYWDLIAYGLYAIPAHLLISFLPHEPALFYVAKEYPPGLVATVGTISCMVAALLDYWLIGFFVSHGLVRSRLDNSRVFLIARKIFGKAPFLLILGSALAPVPFYPVKILAIASGYPLWRFVAAVIVGRWPRFYLLAVGGREFQAPNSWLLLAAAVLEVLTVVGIWQTRRRGRSTAG